MVIRLSAEAIQIKHGRERFSQNMTYPPWQAQKDGKKNRQNKVHKSKPRLPQSGKQIKEQKAPTSSGTDITEPPTIGEFTAAFQGVAQRILDAQKQQEDVQKFLDEHELHPEDLAGGSMESQPTQEALSTKETPPIQKYTPIHQQTTLDILKELERLRAQSEDRTPMVETPSTTEDQGRAKTTSTGQKQNSHRRPSWRSGPYRPPLKEGQSNIKPATQGSTTLNEA